MARDQTTSDRIRTLLAQLTSITESGELHWERQVSSAHRYARWHNNLLIIGPSESSSETSAPRYLFITPFDSPACVEINSNDPELGDLLLQLVSAVERASSNEPPTDPFSIREEVLSRLTNS
jgi:hypothetical protein